MGFTGLFFYSCMGERKEKYGKGKKRNDFLLQGMRF